MRKYVRNYGDHLSIDRININITYSYQKGYDTMLGIDIKQLIITAVGVGAILLCATIMTVVTLWGAVDALDMLLPMG